MTFNIMFIQQNLLLNVQFYVECIQYLPNVKTLTNLTES